MKTSQPARPHIPRASRGLLRLQPNGNLPLSDSGRFIHGLKFTLFAAVFAVAFHCAPYARAANQTWTGGSAINGNWGTTGNWTGSPVPGAGQTATFNAAIANTWGNSTANPVVIDSASQNINTITFTTSAGNYTIGSTVGNPLLNWGNIQIDSGLTATNAVETVNAPLVFSGGPNLINSSANGTGAGAGTLNIGGAISSSNTSGTQTLYLQGSNTNFNTISGNISNGSSGGVVALDKQGAGKWVLSGSNSFSGGITFHTSSGTLVLNNNAAAGTGAIVFNNSDTFDSTVGGITLNNNAVTFGGDTFLGTQSLNMGTGAVTFNSGAFITVQANTLTIGGVCSGGVVNKSGNGTLVLSGLNTFSGSMGIQAGTVSVSNLTVSGGASNLGTVGATFGTASTAGTLSYTGVTGTSGLAFTMAGGAGLGAEIDVTNPGTTLTLTGAFTANNTYGGATGLCTLTIGGAGNLTTTGQFGGGVSGTCNFTKYGSGTLTIIGASSGFRGATNINGGTMALDFSVGSLTMNAGNGVYFGGGNLFVKGKATSTTAQALASVTVNAGGGSVLVNPNGGTSTTITMNALTSTAAGGSLLVGKAAGAGSGNAILTTTTAKDATGIYGGRVVFTSDGGTTVDWSTATGSSPYTLSANSTYSDWVTSSGTDAGNYRITASSSHTIDGNWQSNSLKIENPAAGESLTLGTSMLTLASGGLLVTGTNAAQITGNAGVTGLTGGNNSNGTSGAYDLIVQQYNTGGLSISAVIGDNSGNATALTKAGPGILKLTGANTYTGATYINAGTLQIGDSGTAGSLNTTGTINIATGGTLAFNRSDAIVQGTNFSNSIVGTGSVTQSGSGTVTLGSTGNTYTGATTVSGNGGKLIVSGSLSASAVTVNGDANTTLSGNGLITPNVTLTLGRIAPGSNVSGVNNNFGTADSIRLGMTGGLTLTAAKLDFDLSGTGTAGAS